MIITLTKKLTLLSLLSLIFASSSLISEEPYRHPNNKTPIKTQNGKTITTKNGQPILLGR